MSKYKNKLVKIIQVYLFISVIAYTLFNISPIVYVIIGTPIYSFQKYLGILGFFLVVCSIVINNKIYRKIDVYLLTIIIIIMIYSSLSMLIYGFKDNLFSIIWSMIYIYLFYIYSSLVDKNFFYENIFKVYKILMIIWMPFVLISITSFLFLSGYYIKTNIYYSELTRQGFLENRLFGVFSAINNAAIFSGILILLGIIYYIKFQKKYIICLNLILYIYIVLSGSRSSLYSLYIICLLYFLYYFINKYNCKLYKNILIAVFCSFLSIILMWKGTDFLKLGMDYIPKISVFKENRENYKEIISTIPGIVLKDEIDNNINSTELDDNLLDRKDVNKDNVSNNRFKIWKDYIYIYKSIGLTGLSPNNYSRYIQENYSYLYISSYVKNNFPSMYKQGKVYHPHNGYIHLYTATGIIGIIIFIMLLGSYLFNILKYIKKFDIYLLFIFSIVIFILLNNMFDNVIFFMNNINTCIFWILIGFTTNELKQKKHILINNNM